MAKSKKDNKAQPKPSVKVEDLTPEKDPKGGGLNIGNKTFGKVEFGNKELLSKQTLKIGSTSITDSSFKLHK